MKVPASILARIHAIWQQKGLISSALLPLAWITGHVVQARKRRAQAKGSDSGTLPTIVVGNLLVGGTGKTPVVIAIVQHLQSRGWVPGVVSRGYGAHVGDEPRSGQGLLEPAQFGDEPALIAQATGAPVCVHPRRKLARATLATNFPAVNVVVSDDGLQHLDLTRDIEIVVQDERGIGNGRLLPAGPLREPADKLAEVNFIINNTSADQTRARGNTSAAPAPGPEQIDMTMQPTVVEHLVTGQRLPWSEWLTRHANEPLAAVAAIGQPRRFFDMLRTAGLTPAHTLALPDHDAYEQSPFTALNEAVIAVTAKDAVKCRRHADPRIWAIHVDACFSDPGWLDRLTDRLTKSVVKNPSESIKL